VLENLRSIQHAPGVQMHEVQCFNSFKFDHANSFGCYTWQLVTFLVAELKISHHLVCQVPPDSYFPEYDEDDTNPDERMDRKSNS
jgi:hypothetical protein